MRFSAIDAVGNGLVWINNELNKQGDVWYRAIEWSQQGHLALY